MSDLQRAGGIAALLLAASYVLGMALFLGFLDYTGYDGPAGNVAFVIDHKLILTVAMIALYIIPGCLLVVLGLALHQRLAPMAGPAMQLATSFALIWAAIVIASGMIGLVGMQAIAGLARGSPNEAASAWIAISVVQDGLGGGIELVGGIWVLMSGYIGLQTGELPRALGWLSLAVGTLGILTVAPVLTELAAGFGLSQIIWFVWLGAVMLRKPVHPNPET